ncbi:MAG TPA: alpha/beta fold hydrolase [Pyrinomonadaceae bacterium]|nr:alpha/beta fold hydrolase [Pyrinomonadaceae bacterium]
MSRLSKLWKGLAAGGAAGVAAMVALNSAVERGAPVPEAGALGGEPGTFRWKHGQIFYRHAGPEGTPPVLFVHGIGAGARSFMWRRNFEPISRDLRAYAIDLLGFGYSDKPPTAPYSSDLYVELISDFLRERVGRPAAIVAHTLSAAFAVRVADESPELVSSLVLVSPTGASSLSARPGMAGAAFYGLLHSPVLGTSFYNAVTSERSIRDYARKQLFYQKRFATPRLVAHYYAVSHLPGAQHAATAFISGYMNTDIREAFARLRQPVTIAWGRQDTTNPIEQAGLLLGLNPRARLEVFDRCRLMPQEEHAERFNSLLRETLRPRPS